MITAELNGGLGNMMFQISAAYALAVDNGDSCAFSHHRSPNQGNSSKTYVNNIFRKITFLEKAKINSSSSYEEPSFHFQKIPYIKNLKLNGYFQSEKFFINHSDKIKSLFSPSEQTRQYINKKYSFIKDNCISMHIRRGDYLKFPNMHPVCSKEYYHQALDILMSKHSNYRVIICSDDVSWCRENFKDFEIISEEKDWIDLYLMSMCKHNIVANSSFSWWAAWLNENPEKTIIAPKIFVGPGFGNINTNDVYPENWKRI